MQASADLRRIGHRIGRENPRAAVEWIDKLRKRARLAGSFDTRAPSRARSAPGLGRKVPETDRDDIREAIVGNYRLVYLIQPRTVVILTIFEGHRLLPELDAE